MVEIMVMLGAVVKHKTSAIQLSPHHTASFNAFEAGMARVCVEQTKVSQGVKMRTALAVNHSVVSHPVNEMCIEK